MRTIILPIRKQYSDLILSGEKTVEYRKRFPKVPIERVFIYESRGSGEIVGEFVPGEIHYDSLEELWEKTKGRGGVTKDVFLAYFQDKYESGYGIEIADARRYDSPVPAKEFGVKGKLQDYMYWNGQKGIS